MPDPIAWLLILVGIAIIKMLWRRLTAPKRPATAVVRRVSDAVLGELRLPEDGEWWEGSRELDNRVVGFKIAGDSEPHPDLIQHARDIVREYLEFHRVIHEFLATEIATVKHLKPFADEISKLEIEDICLLRPSRPDNGMIYFHGPNECKVWRCDYVDRKPRQLGFDD